MQQTVEQTQQTLQQIVQGLLGLVVSAGAGCDVSYTLTDSPLLTGTDPLLERQWHLRNTGHSWNPWWYPPPDEVQP